MADKLLGTGKKTPDQGQRNRPYYKPQDGT